MTDTDRPLFAAQLALLAEVYGRTVGREVAEVYFTLLRPFDMAEVAVGVERVLRDSRFFPTPSELLETCREARRERRAVEGSKVVALPQAGTITEAEREDILRQIKAFTDSLAVHMRERGSTHRTVAEMEAEVARLRAADRADADHQAKIAHELERMRRAGLL